ncbi:MAG: hypothetical protein KAJ55_12135, partial [Anaerolineales bacterium]|nr:hypothetical protein [Anaerolineales bacterium]
MSSKANQERVKSNITGIFRITRAWLLVLVLITALFASVQTAEAAGTPTQLITFTDKKVYQDFWFQNGRLSGVPAFVEAETTDDLAVYVFAILLDEDGNMITGEASNLSGNLEDTKRFDHYDKGTDTYHHAVTLDPTFYEAASNSLTFTDDGTSGDDTLGDGIYTAYLNVAEMDGSTLIEDHLLINVTVDYSGTSSITEYYEVMFTGAACHNGETEAHGTHAGTSDGDYDPCTICHHGYEHLYESLSSDNATFSELSSHYYDITPTDTAQTGKNIEEYVWNMSWDDGVTGRDVTWSVIAPGSEYCQACHFASGGSGNAYDYGDGDRSDTTDRPSCNVASKTLDGVSITTVVCHTITTIESTSLSGL